MHYLLSLILLLTIDTVYNRCGHGFLKAPERIFIEQDYQDTRTLLEEDWQPLRIHLDYSLIENNIGKFNKTDVIDLKEKIMPKTQEVLQKLLKVKRNKNKLKLKDTHCDQVKIPDEYIEGEGVDADIVIFVRIDDTGFYLENSIEAAAIHCLQDATTRRPIAGFIQFKPDLKVINSTAADYMIWLAIHEITHVLAFNDILYEDFVDANLKQLGFENVVGKEMLPSGKNMTYIKTKNVVEKGKKHYNCSSFKGANLEYNGGPGTAGAHWSKKYMNTDYMIGDSYGENLISEITLALFEDSGWYKVNYDDANLFLWGQDKGCSFLDVNKKCINSNQETFPSVSNRKNNNTASKNESLKIEKSNNNVKSDNKYKYTSAFKPEFCDKLNYPICSTSHIFRGVCKIKTYTTPLQVYERYFDSNRAGIDSLTDKCPIPIETKMSQKYYGGSCRVGVSTNLDDLQKICPECACFMSNLRKKKNFRATSTNTNVKKTSEELSTNNKYKKLLLENKETDNNSDNKSKNASTPSLRKQQNSKSFITDKMPELTDEDLKASCYEFICKEDKLNVKVNEKEYECQEDGELTQIDGYSGGIVCPPSEVLCHDKFKCKFGCTEKYDNLNGFYDYETS
jgi:hypothetical protein